MTNDPNIAGVKSILETYRAFIQNVQLYGPTNFTPLITKCINIVNSNKGEDIYTILMILTDGIINDMDYTIDAIIEASRLPMSIIIIGIGPGGEDGFKEMEILDSDDKLLTNSEGKSAVRDIVQFVEFSSFNNNPTLLAEKVLEEIPNQLLDYYRMVNKPPGDPIIEIKER
jgi:hypothetical protein